MAETDDYHTGLVSDTITEGLSIYNTQTCSYFMDHHDTVNNSWGMCTQWVNRRSLDLVTLPQVGAKIIMFGFVMVSVIFIILYIIRRILNFK